MAQQERQKAALTEQISRAERAAKEVCVRWGGRGKQPFPPLGCILRVPLPRSINRPETG